MSCWNSSACYRQTYFPAARYIRPELPGVSFAAGWLLATLSSQLLDVGMNLPTFGIEPVQFGSPMQCCHPGRESNTKHATPLCSWDSERCTCERALRLLSSPNSSAACVAMWQDTLVNRTRHFESHRSRLDARSTNAIPEACTQGRIIAPIR